MACDVILHRGSESTALVRDEDFLSRWRDLHRRCPWAGLFQGPDFLGTWYDAYASVYEPVLVVQPGAAGELTGMLALAVDRASKTLALAGRPHAEYYAWLAAPGGGEPFMEPALNRLRRDFPEGVLDFRCLPPGAPVDWLHRGERWIRQCDLTTLPRPLMAIGDGSGAQKSLRSRSNKKHLKSYEILKNLEFLHADDFRHLEDRYQDFMDFCDFRQAAMYGKLPFRGDPNKARFFRALAENPGLLHVTVWRSREGLISAHIGFRDRDQVVLGVLAHSPLMAGHSPGTLHLLFLGRLLADEGVADLDLTPGGAYKDRFMTHADEVARLTVHFSKARFAAKKIGDRAVETLKAGLRTVSITPQRARAFLDRGRRAARMIGGVRSPHKAAALLKSRLDSSAGSLVLRLDRSGPPRNDSLANRDRVGDLLGYRLSDSWSLPLTEFLSRAARRLERGDHVYTSTKDGILTAWAWLRESQDDGDAPFAFPTGSLVLDDFHVDDRDPDSLERLVAGVIQDTPPDQSDRSIFAIVPRSDAAVRSAVERAGFQPV